MVRKRDCIRVNYVDADRIVVTPHGAVEMRIVKIYSDGRVVVKEAKSGYFYTTISEIEESLNAIAGQTSADSADTHNQPILRDPASPESGTLAGTTQADEQA